MNTYEKLSHTTWECKYHIVFIPKYRRKALYSDYLRKRLGYMKGKSAIHIARDYLGRGKNYTGMSFWARGYFVSTVGRDEKVIREYIKNQEKADRQSEQLQPKLL